MLYAPFDFLLIPLWKAWDQIIPDVRRFLVDSQCLRYRDCEILFGDHIFGACCETKSVSSLMRDVSNRLELIPIKWNCRIKTLAIRPKAATHIVLKFIGVVDASVSDFRMSTVLARDIEHDSFSEFVKE
jgi:hypothetical protein